MLQLLLGLAEFCSGQVGSRTVCGCMLDDVGSRKVGSSLCWVSQMCVSLCCVSQSCGIIHNSDMDEIRNSEKIMRVIFVGGCVVLTQDIYSHF